MYCLIVRLWGRETERILVGFALAAQERDGQALCSLAGSRRCRFLVRGPDRDFNMQVPVPQVHGFVILRGRLLFVQEVCSPGCGSRRVLRSHCSLSR